MSVTGAAAPTPEPFSSVVFCKIEEPTGVKATHSKSMSVRSHTPGKTVFETYSTFGLPVRKAEIDERSDRQKSRKHHRQFHRNFPAQQIAAAWSQRPKSS